MADSPEKPLDIETVPSRAEGVSEPVVVLPPNHRLQQDDEPTEEELRTLRRVPDKVSLRIFSIGFIELCERFSFYGTTAVFTNFIQQPMPPGSTTGAGLEVGQAGAMGFGQRASTGLTTFNSFWQYTMPLFGAYVADEYLGRYRTIGWALAVDIIGHCILIVSAVPGVINNPGGSMGCFVIGILLMGVGTGGFKPNVNPLIMEQIPSESKRVITDKKGERVIVDPQETATLVYHWFYWFINVGALMGQVSMIYCEYYVGFYLSYLLPTVMLCLCPLVMLWGRKRYRRVPPQPSTLGKAMKLFQLANKGRWSLNLVATYKRLHDGTFWENVKPSKFAPGAKPEWMTFDDAWVDEVARGFNACAVFLWYPLFWICYRQIDNNLISQAATMKLNGVPNDVLTNLNPFSLIVMIPLFNTVVYPFLRRRRIKFSPIRRIAAGYFVAACSMICACALQAYIYHVSPCGRYASSGAMPDGSDCPPVDISVWAQSGSYVLIALSEILASVTSLEYAHSKAPANMRSMVQAFSLFTSAISAAIGFGMVGLSSDPLLVWNYGVAAGLALLGGTCFWLQFRGLDKEEDHLNMLPKGNFAAKTSEA